MLVAAAGPGGALRDRVGVDVLAAVHRRRHPPRARAHQARRGLASAPRPRACAPATRSCRSTASGSHDWTQVAGLIEHHKAGDHVRHRRRSRAARTVTKNVKLTQHVFDGQTRGDRRRSSATVVVPHPGFLGSIAKAPGQVVVGRARVDQRARHDLLAVGHVEVLPRARRHRQEQGRPEQALPVADRVRERRRRTRSTRAGSRSSACCSCINVFVGLVNLVPLLPFDGGHIADRDVREDLVDRDAAQGARSTRPS